MTDEEIATERDELRAYIDNTAERNTLLEKMLCARNRQQYVGLYLKRTENDRTYYYRVYGIDNDERFVATYFLIQRGDKHRPMNVNMTFLTSSEIARLPKVSKEEFQDQLERAWNEAKNYVENFTEEGEVE